MFNSIFGQAGYAAAAQPILGQLGGLANQYQNNAQSGLNHNQNMLAQQTAAWNASVAGLGQALQQAQHQWMINGKTMTFDQFLDELCPDPEDSMRSLLILKYRGMK